ncbi:MAG: DUF6531 domain-containing protein, partial [Bifidobacteriaceae bacterium]|nr:DUF6531 domain-containing protein [Bifidobacteriaceae bacterium]
MDEPRLGSGLVFASAQSASPPVLTVVFNQAPEVPSNLMVLDDALAESVDSATGVKSFYMKAKRPSVAAVVSDPLGREVRLVAKFPCSSGYVTGSLVSSGSRSTVKQPCDWTDSLGRIEVWAEVANGRRSAGSVSTPSYGFAGSPPSGLTISSPAFGFSGIWSSQGCVNTPFVVEYRDANPGEVEVSWDYSSQWQVVEGSFGKTKVNVPCDRWGPHRLAVRARNRAGWVSEVAEFLFSTSAVDAIITPKGAATVSSGVFRVEALGLAAPAGHYVVPSLYWRVSGAQDDPGWSGSIEGWRLASQGAAVLGADGRGTRMSYNFSGKTAAATAKSLGLISSDRLPVRFDLQVCFEIDPWLGQEIRVCSWNSEPASHVSVTWLARAFGDAFPVAEAGPGRVGLLSGELVLDTVDVSVPGYVGELAVSRSYASLAGSTVATSVNRVFGAGWNASFEGEEASGLAGLDLLASFDVDGVFSVLGGDGDGYRFMFPEGALPGLRAGVLVPADDVTKELGGRFELVRAGAGWQAVLTGADGTQTVWRTPDSGTWGRGVGWLPVSVWQTGSPSKTTYSYDSAGRVTRVLAPVPAGVSCGAGASLSAGCRALHVAYASATTAGTSALGLSKGLVSQISYQAWDPDKPGGAGMNTVVVAQYLYDSQGLLRKITDPRSGLATEYSYSGVSPAGVPLLASVTQSGLAAWRFIFGNSPVGAGVLLGVSRDSAEGSGAAVQQARFVYNVPVSGTGLPDLSNQTVGLWAQTSPPVRGFAVFGPDRPISQAGAADWVFADLQYVNQDGRVVNTAVYGAGAWQLTATDYDAAGRVVRQFDQAGVDRVRRAATASGVLNGRAVASSDDYATITRYNAEVRTAAVASINVTGAAASLPRGTVIIPEGSLVTDVWEPVVGLNRLHTHTDYDQGAPNNGVNPKTGQGWMLPTQVTVSSATARGPASTVASEPVVGQTRQGYGVDNDASASGPTSGWVLGQPTTATTVMGGGEPDIVARTVYDNEGRPVESRQPMSNGVDAGTTKTVYYTAAANTTGAPQCGNKPQWAGLTCKTMPAGLAGGGRKTITTLVENYSMYLAAARVVETGDANAIRTTNTTFLADGRVNTVAVTVSGVAGSTAVPTLKTVYDPLSGLATQSQSLDANGRVSSSIRKVFDKWARVTGYVDSLGTYTYTTYNQAGQVASVDDGKTITKYTYDSSSEHRGLLTGQSSGGQLVFNATYDAAGNLATQQLPGGITQTNYYDAVGNRYGLIYSVQSVPYVSWSRSFDVAGRVTVESTPDTQPGSVGAWVKEYSYDQAGRLTQVNDRTVKLNNDLTAVDASCTIRKYVYDRNGNRTRMFNLNGGSQQVCQPGSGTVKTWTYDSADRLVASTAAGGQGHTYDGLGRVTSIPAGDAPSGGTGALQISYTHTDQATWVGRTGKSTAYLFDPAGRRIHSLGETLGDPLVSWHYADDSDSPGWTELPGTGQVTRYVEAIGGDLGVTVSDNQTVLQLVDMQGNVTSTITVPAAGYPTNMRPLQRYDEWGNPQTSPATVSMSTVSLNYGWLGGKQRATDLTGLLLMGVRLYNPVTAQFTSPDPVPGGNTTTNAYPQDPVNSLDMTGKFSFPFRKVFK